MDFLTGCCSPVSDPLRSFRRYNIGMLVECECGARYRYDERKFQGATQRRLDCPKCNKTIVVNNPKINKTKAHEAVLESNLKQLAAPTFTLSILKGITGGKIVTLNPGTKTTIGRMGADI